MNISHKLKLYNNQHYPLIQKKKYITVHHTAGFSAQSAIEWWNQTPAHVGTAYVIERDGTIFEAFDPQCWAYHLGIGNQLIEKQSIGIELVSLGGIRKHGEDFIAYGKVIDPKEIVKKSFRGFEYFQKYTPEQIESFHKLTLMLSERFGIKLKWPKDPFEYSEELEEGVTIFPHCYVRKDKSDPYPDGRFHLWKVEKEVDNIPPPIDSSLEGAPNKKRKTRKKRRS